MAGGPHGSGTASIPWTLKFLGNGRGVMVAWPPGLRSVNSQPESYCDRKLTLRVGRLAALAPFAPFSRVSPHSGNHHRCRVCCVARLPLLEPGLDLPTLRNRLESGCFSDLERLKLSG